MGNAGVLQDRQKRQQHVWTCNTGQLPKSLDVDCIHYYQCLNVSVLISLFCNKTHKSTMYIYGVFFQVDFDTYTLASITRDDIN